MGYRNGRVIKIIPDLEFHKIWKLCSRIPQKDEFLKLVLNRFLDTYINLEKYGIDFKNSLHIYNVCHTYCHMPLKDICKISNYSPTALMHIFCIPNSTFFQWYNDERQCPSYVKLQILRFLRLLDLGKYIRVQSERDYEASKPKKYKKNNPDSQPIVTESVIRDDDELLKIYEIYAHITSTRDLYFAYLKTEPDLSKNNEYSVQASMQNVRNEIIGGNFSSIDVKAIFDKLIMLRVESRNLSYPKGDPYNGDKDDDDDDLLDFDFAIDDAIKKQKQVSSSEEDNSKFMKEFDFSFIPVDDSKPVSGAKSRKVDPFMGELQFFQKLAVIDLDDKFANLNKLLESDFEDDSQDDREDIDKNTQNSTVTDLDDNFDLLNHLLETDFDDESQDDREDIDKNTQNSTVTDLDDNFDLLNHLLETDFDDESQDDQDEIDTSTKVLSLDELDELSDDEYEKYLQQFTSGKRG